MADDIQEFDVDLPADTYVSDMDAGPSDTAFSPSVNRVGEEGTRGEEIDISRFRTQLIHLSINP